MNFRLVGPALLAMMMAALAGCGGGGGSGGGGAAVVPPPSPITTPGATITGITVNSPPVLTFAVNDANGIPVTGLKLFDAGGTATDPACGGANVSFAIAKHDGIDWQSLISRQRYAVSTPGKNAVIEATTDPKPTASITNPATALNDPSTRVVGILEEANGVYTYRFATDVTTPLLMANAVDGKNVALGKVANNGNLAVKDGHTLHRVALQLCFVDPVTQETVKLNPYMDFTLGANGNGVPFKDGQGNLIPAIQVVDRASCNECHQNFAQHGGNRVDPQYCVMCHNPGSTDFETGNPIDFALMVHKFHMGKRLTQDYAVRSAIARKTDTGTGAITGVLYPQDQRNCVKCHDGSTTAVHKTAQGNNWINKVSKKGCFSCHDDYKTPGSRWQIQHAGYANTTGFYPAYPDAIPDYICQSCHNYLGLVAKTSAKEHEIQEQVRGENYKLNIWGINKNADNTLTVEYSVSDPNDCTDPTKPETCTNYDLLDPQYQFSIVNPAGTTTTKMFRFGALTLLFGWNSTDYANDGAIGRPWNSSCTTAVPAPASPTCDVNSGKPMAKAAGSLTRGQPVAINALFDASVQRVAGGSNRFKLTSTVLPAAANGTLSVAFQGHVSALKKDLNGLDMPNTSLNLQVKNVVSHFAMNGSSLERRQVVSADKCNACHGPNLAFTDVNTRKPVLAGNDGIHDGSQTDPAVCVICHNGNAPLKVSYVLDSGVSAESADFKRMIHMKHAEQADNYPVWPSVLLTSGYMAGKYQGLRNCNLCHVNDSQLANRSVLGSSVTFNTVASTNKVISPKASVCSSCHDSAAARTHMIDAGSASFGTRTQGEFGVGIGFEGCDGCHAPSGIAPFELMHLGLKQ